MANSYTTEERIQSDGQSRSARADRSITELIKELRDETIELVREEVSLAKTEVTENVNRVARNSVYLGVGALIAFAGLIILLFAASAGAYVGLIAAGVANATAGWLAPLIVGGVVLLIGYAFVQKAISTLKEASLVPERTVRSVKEDKNWVKQKVAK
ncbi:MAG: phage holin family protein [Planctomycetaceae bacterium]